MTDDTRETSMLREDFRTCLQELSQNNYLPIGPDHAPWVVKLTNHGVSPLMIMFIKNARRHEFIYGPDYDSGATSWARGTTWTYRVVPWYPGARPDHHPWYPGARGPDGIAGDGEDSTIWIPRWVHLLDMAYPRSELGERIVFDPNVKPQNEGKPRRRFWAAVRRCSREPGLRDAVLSLGGLVRSFTEPGEHVPADMGIRMLFGDPPIRL